MIIKKRKYTALIASILLSANLFLSVVSVFHFHHIEYDNPEALSKLENNQSKFQHNNNGLNCFVIQNYNSLHTTITNNLSVNEIFIADIDVLLSLEQSNNIHSYSFTSFHLRAPPTSFS
jgi:hypothetical protein